MADILMPQLIQLAQLLIVWLNEKYRQKENIQKLELNDFRIWLTQKNHEEILSFLTESKENTRKVNEVLEQISKKVDFTQQFLASLLKDKFNVEISPPQAIWKRPHLERFGEKWHYIIEEEKGEVEFFCAKWKLRVPYQAQLMSKQFHLSIREAVDRMDAEGPFCNSCGVELIQDIKQDGIYWMCDGCSQSIKSDLLLEEARAKVVRINKPKILILWLDKYGDK